MLRGGGANTWMGVFITSLGEELVPLVASQGVDLQICVFLANSDALARREAEPKDLADKFKTSMYATVF